MLRWGYFTEFRLPWHWYRNQQRLLVLKDLTAVIPLTWPSYHLKIKPYNHNNIFWLSFAFNFFYHCNCSSREPLRFFNLLPQLYNVSYLEPGNGIIIALRAATIPDLAPPSAQMTVLYRYRSFPLFL